MFWAAVESAAFVESDPMTLIRIGLNMIPLSSHIARSIREAVWCFEHGLNWGAARERIASRFGHIQPCNAIPNHGFIIIGWLCGADYGDRLCKAVNCGYDTDCTGATLGALLGILGGTAGIPEEWRKPIGDQIVVHPYTRNFTPPATIGALTERTVALAERAATAERAFGEATRLPADLRTRLFRNEKARAALQQDIHAGIELLGGREVAFHYGGEPVLRPGIGTAVWVTVDDAPAQVTLTVPAGWTAESLGSGRFLLSCHGEVADRNTVTVALDGSSVDFTILGPGEAVGFPAGDNVQTCPHCRARSEACICAAVAAAEK